MDNPTLGYDPEERRCLEIAMAEHEYWQSVVPGRHDFNEMNVGGMAASDNIVRAIRSRLPAEQVKEAIRRRGAPPCSLSSDANQPEPSIEIRRG